MKNLIAKLHFLSHPYIAGILTVVGLLTIVVLTTKGLVDTFDANGEVENNLSTAVGSPFEASNTTSRYALTQAIVEDKRFALSLDQARFAAPDMIDYNDKFYTIFTPGISFVAVPFYIIGQYLGEEQLVTFLSTVLFALINVALITKISYLLTKNVHASLLGGLLFLVGTNALPYAQTLTQHHGSTTVLLAAYLLALSTPNSKRNILFGILCGLGMLFDIPNLFLLFPIGLYILSQHFKVEQIKKKTVLHIKPVFLTIAVGLVPFIMLFGWYNIQTTGSPLLLAQLFPQSEYFDTQEVQEMKRANRQNVDPFGDKLPFSTRSQLRSFYILFVSNERSWLHYSPILLLGFTAFIKNGKRLSEKEVVLLLTVIVTNFILYGMFGDPWGGWSFGPRYLIPAAGLTSILLAMAIDRHGKNLLFIALFTLLGLHSIQLATASVLTTATIPPKVEAEQLDVFIPYTYTYNFQLLEAGRTSSLLYKTYLSEHLSVYQYWQIIVMIASVQVGFLYIAGLLHSTRSSNA